MTALKYCKKHKHEYASGTCVKCSERHAKIKNKIMVCQKHNISYKYPKRCSSCTKEYYDKKRGNTKHCNIHNIDYTSVRCSDCQKIKRKSIKLCKKHEIEYKQKDCPNCSKETWQKRKKNINNNGAYCKKHDLVYYKTICSKCYIERKNQIKKCRVHNIEYFTDCKSCTRKRRKDKIKNDPIFKLRMAISGHLRQAFKKAGKTKNKRSYVKLLNYSPKELLNHLMHHSEKENWMTIEKWGVYRVKTWNDNDSSTWTWQIDHIIPVSFLAEKVRNKEITEEAFIKMSCSLKNLRPYSAKQNVLDGISKIRHEKINKELIEELFKETIY